MVLEKVIIIRDKTRLEQLIERFNSKAQAKFYLEKSGDDFSFYEREHNIFYESLKVVENSISELFKSKVLFRSFLPTYIFAEGDLIIVLGQDGLVANTAKYVNGLPIIAVNPDSKKYDGVLLPHRPESFMAAVKRCMEDTHNSTMVTMAKATLNDGQWLLAFNDFYIGASSHVSSRYKINFGDKIENQSSSGIIVSTGAGSTGWLSSVFNMAGNITKYYGHEKNLSRTFKWDSKQLMFVVREPFRSKMSQIDIGCGIITPRKPLKLESNMPSKGIIFSDGVESDFLNFNSGNSVEIGIAEEKANLVL